MKITLKPVRGASPEERREFVAFANLNFTGGMKMKASQVNETGRYFFWALHAGKRVGITGYIERTRHLAETIKTVVSSKLRGQGFGSSISEAIEREVQRKGFGKIRTTIYVTNIPMVVIKLRQGYLFEGVHPSHEAPGLDEYSFGKLIGPM